MVLKEVDVKSLDINPFTAIGDDWMLVTAGDAASHNTMTASWGGLGVLWGAPVAVDGTTTFAEARLTLVCRKAYATYLGPEGFVAQPGTADDARWYQDHDYHTMYIGKIEHAYVAE